MTHPIKRRVRRSQEEWQQLVDEQQRSSLSQRAFCQSKGISVASLQNWKRRLLSREAGEWLELGQVSTATSPGWDIELDLGHGVCLRLRRSEC